MAQFAKPFWRAPRRRWYVQLGNQQINLGADKLEAFRRYHALMAARGTENKCPVKQDSVLAILDLYLDWCKKHRKARTFAWYTDYLQSFAEAIPTDLTIDALKPFHIEHWLDAKPAWKTGRRGAITAIQRVFNWAETLGYIERNPIRRMEKPPAGRREQLISPHEFHKIIDLAHDQRFRDLVTAVWETGCRPDEVFRVETRHFNEETRCWIFPPEEAKGNKHYRVVYLPDQTFAITKRLTTLHPAGPLFRNTEGNSWCVSSVKCRFQRIRKKLGVRYNLYAMRHSYCTRALKNGVDAVTTARLMGHRTLAMINRVYAHVEKDINHMNQAARQAANA